MNLYSTLNKPSSIAKTLTLMCSLLTIGYAHSYCQDSPVDGSVYKVVNTGSDLLLNVENASTSSGANINTLSNNGHASQRFYLHYQTSSHYWKIESADTGYLVDLSSASTSNGVNVVQAPDDGNNSQEWELKQQTNGSYRIVNRYSSLSLTVAGSNQGANTYQNSDASGSSQRWWLEPVSSACSGTAINEVILLSGHAGDSSVSLSWNTISNINSLQVYYDTDSNPSGRSRLAILNTSNNSYTASGLNNGTTYWFWIKYRTNDSVWHNSNAFRAQPLASGSSSFTVSGFASTDGSTSGGANGRIVTANSCSSLKSSLASSETLTIQIPNSVIDCKTSGTTISACKIACPAYQDDGKYTYRIPTSNLSCNDLGAEGTSTKYRYDQRLNVASNKTVIGLGSNATVEGATFYVKNASNVIFRNLSIENINPDLVEGGDGITVEDSDHVVIDHVNFDMISDGHVDIKRSENVTLSYNRFNGYNPYVCANQHWYTNAVDESEVTFHHNFWNKPAGRNPKLTGSSTIAHLFNNYWLDVSYFSIGADNGASVLVEANYFDDAARPHWDQGSGSIDGNISSNVYTGRASSGSYSVQDSGANITVPYSYSLDNVYSMPDLANHTGTE